MTTENRVVYQFTDPGYADLPPRTMRKGFQRSRLCQSCIPPQVTMTGGSHELMSYEHAPDCPTQVRR